MCVALCTQRKHYSLLHYTLIHMLNAKWSKNRVVDNNKIMSNSLLFSHNKQLLVGLIAQLVEHCTIMHFIIWQAQREGSMRRILCSDWLPEQARWSDTGRLGLPVSFPQIKFKFCQSSSKCTKVFFRRIIFY